MPSPFRFKRLRPGRADRPRVGLARALSKIGFCSRSQAWGLIEAGQVRVNGAVRRDPQWRVDPEQDRFEVDGKAIQGAAKIYLMLNKPRGLVTTASDEQGRQTVYTCLAEKGFPFVSPAGRLDKASEGLLLFSNDTAWTARLTEPESGMEKTYHVQVDCLADETLLGRMRAGVQVEGDFLAAKRATVLRLGGRNSWIEVVLDEGRNRHIRRLLEALGVAVLRLVRVAIGQLALGTLAKGQCRLLTPEEVLALGK